MKVAILAEMLLLYSGGIVSARQTGEPWTDILMGRAWKQGLAVAILLALLLTLVDIGVGGMAVVLGGLIVLGYLAGTGKMFGPQLVQLEKGLFAYPPAPTGVGPGNVQ